MEGLQQLFREYQNKKVALYGLSTETERTLPQLSRVFQIIGLLDGSRETGELYGQPIISMEEGVRQGAELILVVARPESCKVITKRIEKVCIEKKIALFDIRGKNLLEEKKAVYHLKGLRGVSKKEMLRQIHCHEVISVDLFDTLIMRNSLFPTDIFELAEARLRALGISIENFSKKRLESEKYLSKTSAPGLTEIYRRMIGVDSIAGFSAETLAELEYEIDCSVTIRRREICELLEQVRETGKEIYLVSDTYYTKAQLIRLLEKMDIRFYTDILASCDYGTSKTQQLYDRLKEKVGGRSCLHIGNDPLADIECAKRYGIDTCKVHSGTELLEAVGYFGLWDQLESLADRIRVGMFTARLFNSPFQFETEDRRIRVSCARDIGYLFFAPMISDFVLWFAEQVERYGLRNVWFGARDGYLIKRLYDELKGDDSSIYLLTSRTAAIRAGMERKEDIEYVGEMKFSGTLTEQLRERFGIVCFSEDQEKERAQGELSLSDFSEKIFKKASLCRKNYKRYLERLPVREGDIAFFDFVAKGTSQLYMERLVEKHMKGLYFLRLEEEAMRDKELDIVPFYKSEERENSAIFENYYIMETILTSPMPSIQEFDEEGEPCYAQETRTKEDISCFQAVQEGIFHFFRDYISACPESERKINRKMAELCLELIHHIVITDGDFLGLVVEDPFFNRKTNITDVL